MAFAKATKKQGRLRLGLCGPSGSGKTFTALRIAMGLCAQGKRVALIDSERGSASLYAGKFDFDVAELPDFRVQTYTRLLREAEQAGYDVAILDSISHAWAGKGGLLEQVDNAKGDQRNKFTAWRDVTPQHHDFIDAMLLSPLHIIATMRAKTEYVLEENERGQKVPKKVGMAPVQRDGMEYEFTLVGDLDGATLRVSKTRIPEVVPLGAVVREPGEDLGRRLAEWLATGLVPEPRPPPAPPPETPPQDQFFQRIATFAKGAGWNPDQIAAWVRGRGRTKRSDVTEEDVHALKLVLEAEEVAKKEHLDSLRLVPRPEDDDAPF